MLAPDPWAPGGVSAQRGCYQGELFASSQITVTTIECGADRRGALHVRTWDEPVIVLVRTGRFGRRIAGRCAVVDSTQGYVGHQGGEELIQHLGYPGHRCTVLALRSEALPPLFRVRSRLVPTEFRTSPATDLAHRRLLAECRRGGDRAVIADMAATLVADLFAGWAQSSASAHRVGTRAATRHVVDIARELVTTNSVPPSLQAVATAANISPHYLTRVFRQSTGMTLSRYRNRVRVRLALEMLAEEEGDLKLIAHDLGFFDHSHFSRIVMAEVGLSPRTLRRLLSVPSAASFYPVAAAPIRPAVTRLA